MRVIEYEEWKESLKDQMEKCSDCDGEGELECDLGHLHDCTECDGEGETGPDDSMRAYCEAVSTDLNRVLLYCGRIPGGLPDLPMVQYSPFVDGKPSNLIMWVAA